MTDDLPAAAGSETPEPSRPTEAAPAVTVSEETPAGAVAGHEPAASHSAEPAPGEAPPPPQPDVVPSSTEAPPAEKPAEKKAKTRRGGKEKASEEAGEEKPAEAPTATGEGAPAAAAPSNKRWYAVKVQSGREDTIKDAIERRVKIEGLEEFFGQIVIPVEYVPEMRRGKRVERRHKLYPGYLMVEVEFNDRMLYLFRETSGVGDFVGGHGIEKPPPPLTDLEVERIVNQAQRGPRAPGKSPTETTRPMPRSRFSVGDRLKVLEGTFAGMEGEVIEILEERGLVRLQVTILGRPVSCELEYWQVETA
jgi:transcriptional antiterminator NusG